jgi:hypothetical protein
MKLFGVESEEATQILEKLQGLLFVTQAIQGFGALPDSIAQIKAGLSSLTAVRAADLTVQQASIAADTAEATTTTINTAAQAANTVGVEAHAGAMVVDTVATEGATVATAGFTAALAANPIGLVVVGLTALIGALFIFSDNEKTAKSNIDETTTSMLEQAGVMKQQEDAFIELYKTRKELEILSEKDATKRADMQASLDEEIFGMQEKSLADLVSKQVDANAKLLENFNEYKAAYIGERQVLVREVAQFDEFGIFIGMEQQYRTEKFKIGAATLQDLKDRLKNEKDEIKKDIDSKKITSDEGRIKEEQATTRFYIAYLTRQKGFLAQSQFADDTAKAENLTKLIASFNKVRTALEKALTDQIKLQQDADKKKLEEQQKADDEAERKRQASLEKARADYKRSYDDIVKTVKDANKQLNDIETNNIQALDKLRLDQTTSTLDNLEYELKLERDKVNEVAKLAQEQLKSSVLYNKKKKQFTTEGAKAESDINKNLKEALDQLDIFYAEKKKITTQDEIDLEQQKADKIKQINEILNSEISFGDQSVADQKRLLLGEEGLLQQKLAIETLDTQAQINNLSLQGYLKYLNERAAAQAAVNEQQRLIDEAVAADEARKAFDNFADLLTKEGILSKDFDKQELDRIKALNAEEAKLEIDALNKKAADLNRELTSEERARLALLQTQVNQQQQLSQKKTEIDTKYRNEKDKADKKLEDDVLKYKISKLEEYNKIFGELSNAVLGLFNALFEGFKVEEENRLNALRDANNTAINEVTTNYNTQLATLEDNYAKGIISQEQYNKASTDLEASRKKSIEDLDKSLKDAQLKSQKDAFEKEKKLKIAQATIAGIQGAISAFTGAFQLGPIAGPIVGGILAALVAATTAVQISNIKKTKFDSGGNVELISANAASADVGQAVANSSLPQGGGFTTFSEGAMGTPGGFVPSTPFSGTSNNQRVYVVESDITAAQNRVRVLEKNSTFG